MDPLAWLRKQLEEADVDLLREMVRSFVEALMGAEADALCGAGFRERSAERVNRRNGYRARPFDTRTGTIALAVPKLRSGSYFPDWLLERRRRAERALVAVVAECYVRGVSTRRVDGLVKTLGIEGLTKCPVSAMAAWLERWRAFRYRPFDNGPYTYLWLDALAVRVREGGRIVRVACVVATAVSGDGLREILGLDVFTSEDEAAWSGLPPAVSSSVASPACGSSSRTTTEALCGRSTRICPEQAGGVADALHAQPALPGTEERPALRRHPGAPIFAQPSAKEVAAQLERVFEQLARRFPAAAELLEAAAPRSPPSPPSRWPTGARSGPTTPRSASTARSAAVAT